MSQSQVQQKTVLVNGVNRRRGDQDFGNTSDNFRREYNRSSRSGSSNHGRIEGGGHQHINHAGSNTSVNQAGFSKDKAEATTSTESRGGSQGPWNQHLLQLTACLIGQPVEVQVKCGSIYSGVFHTANAEKNHGIVLKMVRLIKDGALKGKADPGKELAVRPYKEYVIFARDIVQIIAKDVPLRGETLQNGRMRENRAEMLTDSLLSQVRHGDLERELKPWTPDTNDSRDLELESTFENTWNRNWDQFEINKTLFGVESTFDEELYTTKLERGPQMREREREAWRIAREIEQQSTKNPHLAEERGGPLAKDFELDEESKYSSVLRQNEVACKEMVDFCIEAHSTETLGSPVAEGLNNTAESENNSVGSRKDHGLASGNTGVAALANKDEMQKEKSPHDVIGDRAKHSIKVGAFSSPRSSSLLGDTTSLQALNLDPGSPHVTEDVYREFNEFKQQENAKRGKQHREDQVNELKSFSKSLKDLAVVRQHGATTTGSARKTAAAFAPPASALPLPTSIANPTSLFNGSDSSAPQNHVVPLHKRADCMRVEGGLLLQPEVPSTSTASSMTIDLPVSPLNSTPSTTVPSSPSSELSSSTSSTKKSSLNPHAKEFKLNPNAKSFTPNFTPLRPPSPIVHASSFVPGMVTQAALAQNVPLGVPGNPQTSQVGQPGSKYTPYSNVSVSGASGGAPFLPLPPAFIGGQAPMKVPPQLQQPAMGNSYGPQQPVRYPSQAPVMQSTSTYMHPNGHLYPQQMMFGQPGQVVYYQPYPQGLAMPPPQPTSAPPQQIQTTQRGAGMHEMQMCMAPPYIAGQQHFLPPLQMPQLPNSGQPSPGSNVLPTMQPPQGVVGGPTPTLSFDFEVDVRIEQLSEPRDEVSNNEAGAESDKEVEFDDEDAKVQIEVDIFGASDLIEDERLTNDFC
ncbi:hypothetical protein L7F22_001154 [Adiantum nelumboides]|nr:hypothetical protein [Adiantum nelumboides]